MADLNRLVAVGPARRVLVGLLAVLAVAGAAFSAVTEDVLDNGELVRVDGPASRFLVEHREAWLTTVMGVITQLGSAVVLTPLLLLLALIVRRRYGSWRPALFLGAAVGGAALTSSLIKLLVARPRPTSGALVEAFGYAFPSGHSTAAAAGWLSMALVVGSLTRSVALRVGLLSAAVLIVFAVGVSRVYLGVHAATDVLAGWGLGVLWVTAVVTATRLLPRSADVGVGGGYVRRTSAP